MGAPQKRTALSGRFSAQRSPQNRAVFGQGYLVGPISIELALFTLFAILFGMFLHRTRWGRAVYAIGANEEEPRSLLAGLAALSAAGSFGLELSFL